MSHFDETGGAVTCKTLWGQWWQTMEEVYITVDVEEGTLAKQIKCTIKPKHIQLTVNGALVFQGDLKETVQADEAIWTLEDKKLIRICLPKVLTTADHCWSSLLAEQYEADPWTLDRMQQKLTLQRYQFENPGMDFSGATITGNYQEGGPPLPS